MINATRHQPLLPQPSMRQPPAPTSSAPSTSATSTPSMLASPSSTSAIATSPSSSPRRLYQDYHQQHQLLHNLSALGLHHLPPLSALGPLPGDFSSGAAEPATNSQAPPFLIPAHHQLLQPSYGSATMRRQDEAVSKQLGSGAGDLNGLSGTSSNPFYLPPLMPAATQADASRNPIALLPQLAASGQPGGSAFPGLGTSTLAIVNGVPVMLDLAKLVELMQMGASLAMVQPTPDIVNSAAFGGMGGGVGVPSSTDGSAWLPAQFGATKTEGRRSPQGCLDDDLDHSPGHSPSVGGAGERGPIESVWCKRMAELRAFHDRFGHTDVKRGGEGWESLARWLDNLKKKWARREGYVPPDKAILLRQLGIEPYRERDDRVGELHRDRKRNGMSDEDRWEVRIQQISEFKRAHGHLKIPKNSQSALYYWAYGAKKKWRKYKDKRQRDLVQIGLITAEEYERERVAKQGSTEFGRSSSSSRGSSQPLNGPHQQQQPALPFKTGSAPSDTPSLRTINDQRVPPTERKNDLPYPTANKREVMKEPASAATGGGLLHLGLIGEEEYEKEVVHNVTTASSSPTLTPTASKAGLSPLRPVTAGPSVSPARSPVLRNPMELDSSSAARSTDGGTGGGAGMDRKLKDLVALGLLSWEEYERQRGPAAATKEVGGGVRHPSDLKRRLNDGDHRGASATESRLPTIVVDDESVSGVPDGGGQEGRASKRGRVNSFNDLLLSHRRDDSPTAVAVKRDERSDGEEPLTGGEDDERETGSEMSMPRNVKDEQRWHLRLQQMHEFLAKHGHFNVPRSINSQLYYWAYGAKRKWREWSLDKQRDLVSLGLVGREEFEAYTGRKWADVSSSSSSSSSSTSPAKKRRLESSTAHSSHSSEECEESRRLRSEDEDTWGGEDGHASDEGEMGSPGSGGSSRKRTRRERSKGSFGSDGQRRSTSEEGLEEYRRRAFGGTDEERWAMRIRELKELEEQEGTWCVPRRWSKSLKRWLEYMKLRWRSGRLTEKQIGDLTGIGIIKDERFYGIRDKKELDRGDQHRLDSDDHHPMPLVTASSAYHSRRGSDGSEGEESYRDEGRERGRMPGMPAEDREEAFEDENEDEERDEYERDEAHAEETEEASGSWRQQQQQQKQAVAGEACSDQDRARPVQRWQHRALPPLAGPPPSANVDVDNNSARPSAERQRQSARLVPTTMTAAEMVTKGQTAVIDGATTKEGRVGGGPVRDGMMTEEDVLKRANLEVIRLMWLQEREKQRAGQLRDEMLRREKDEIQQQLPLPPQPWQPSSVVQSKRIPQTEECHEEDDQDSLEIAEDGGEEDEDADRDLEECERCMEGGGENDSHDVHHQHGHSNGNNNGHGDNSDGNGLDGEVGILYEVETEEEWKKLTKEQRRRRRMAQLHQFFAEFGHGNVQHQWPKNKRLANWVYEQKQRWRKGLLSEAEMEEFEALKMRKPRPGFGRPPKRRRNDDDSSAGSGRGSPTLPEDSGCAGGQSGLKKRRKRTSSSNKSSPDDRTEGKPAASTSILTPPSSTTPSPTGVGVPISASSLLSPSSFSSLLTPSSLAGLQRLPSAASILSYLAPMNHLLPPIIFPATAGPSGTTAREDEIGDEEKRG